MAVLCMHKEFTMPLLQVRDCPEDIYKKISYIARKQNRTIAQQILVTLEKGLNQDTSNVERRRALLDRIHERTIPLAALQIDDVTLIKEDRKR